jgi:hypothetical protein
VARAVTRVTLVNLATELETCCAVYQIERSWQSEESGRYTKRSTMILSCSKSM